MPQYRHEWNQSENERFYNACKKADLTDSEIDRYSDVYHELPDRERMTFDAIVTAAREWKNGSGGGFRRSDRP